MAKPWLLTKREDYIAVYQNGSALTSKLIVMKKKPNDLDHTRYGFSVSKAVGKAVVRNKVKRQLKEICRLQRVREGWDIVLIARRGASSAEYYQLKDTVIRLLNRAGLLPEKYETYSTKFN